jgi:hypothetical protein
MGTVIRLPESARATRAAKFMAIRRESATVIILPVIRIERYADEPSQPDATRHPRRRRRRRVSRT